MAHEVEVQVLREWCRALAEMVGQNLQQVPRPALAELRALSLAISVLETKPSESSMVQRIEAWEAFGRKVAATTVGAYHDGDEETGVHDEDCAACAIDALKAEANLLLHGPPDPERDREARPEVERP